MKSVSRRLKLFIKNSNWLRKIYLKIYFKNELKLYNGKLKEKSKKTSIIHFSVNKSATQTAKSILTYCAERNHILPVHWTNLAFNSEHPALCYSTRNEVEKYSHIFKETGFFYSAFGGFVEGIPNIDKFKIILMLRDPRDILISDYYSIAYSHLPPSKVDSAKYTQFMKRRNEALNSNIDEYVLSNMDRVFLQFERYKNHLLGKENNILILKYEEMIGDFENWLNKIIDFCEFRNIDIERLKSKYKKTPSKESANRHIRKGIAGDYINKLKKETIEKINKKYSHLLAEFNY